MFMEHRTIWGGISKKLRRISDGMEVGNERNLGYAYYIGGQKLDEPIWELSDHYERVEIPLAELRLGMIFKDENDGTPYTIVSFSEDGNPIYKKGEHGVEYPEGYWEQFDQPTEGVEFMTQDEIDESVNEGDFIETSSGEKLKCVGFDNGEPMWEFVKD